MKLKIDERGVLSPVVIIVMVVFLGVAGFAVLRVASKDDTKKAPATASSNTPANGYEAAVDKFIKSVQTKDKATADGLQSPAFQVSNKEAAGTASFYEACETAGELCAGSFSSEFLGKGTKTSEDYTAADGTKGKQTVYTVKAEGSTTILKIAAIPSGSSWLIDFIDLGGEFGGSVSGEAQT